MKKSQPGIFKETAIHRATVNRGFQFYKEKYLFLRILLANELNSTFFQLLRIVNGITYVTFLSAYQALNLLVNDRDLTENYIECLGFFHRQ